MRSRPGRFRVRTAPPRLVHKRIIGRRIRRVRRRQGMTMTDLAAACGLYHAEVRYIEDGRFVMEFVPIIACALGVPTAELVTGTFAWIPPVPRAPRSVR